MRNTMAYKWRETQFGFAIYVEKEQKWERGLLLFQQEDLRIATKIGPPGANESSVDVYQDY